MHSAHAFQALPLRLLSSAILISFWGILSACGFRQADVPLPLLTLPVASTETTVTPTISIPVPATPTGQLDPMPGSVSTPILSFTPTLPAPPQPRLSQLTDGGCCVQPFWSPDSQRVFFIDRPAADQPTGIWSVGLEGGEPELFSDRLGIYSPDFSLRALLVGQQTVVERISDGQRWTIPNGGRLVSFSPDGKHLGWVAGEAGPPFDTARREIWISNIDGSEARLVRTLTGGSLSGWFPDGDLLVSGRLDDAQFQQAYWKLSISNASQESSLRELVRGERLRSGLLSPDGRWLVYAVTFSGDASQDGLWLLDVETLEKRRLDFFGAYRWRDAGRLLFVPLDLNQNQHALWQFDTSNGAMQPLITPETMPVKIAGGDWAVSPDGQKVVFLSAADQNLWLIEFP